MNSPQKPGSDLDATTSEATAEPAPTVTEPIDAVQSQLTEARTLARPLREVLALLSSGAQPLADLVRRTAVPRRTVEELLSSAGSDIEQSHGTFRLAPAARVRYRERFALDELSDPRGSALREPETALGLLREFLDTGPRPQAALDHVSATPETVLRRAEWLREHHDLGGARLLCLGDHDLTSLAVSLVEPSVSVTVVDLDERILAHVDTVAAEHGFPVRTLHADLRFGLPPAVESEADLVFTDPPYTPEGVGLFAARAAECCTGQNSRVLLAYGFSDRSPALGHKVQQELLRLGMVFEAILPGFHRYYGAQAIGSASALYVCRPTAHTRKRTLRETAGIYTHGPQSVETRQSEVSTEFLRTIGERLGTSIIKLREPSWSRPIRQGRDVSAFDLRADPGPWLLRMLLACNSQRVAILVGNNHPDCVSEAAQRDLATLVASKYALRFHRSMPDSKHAIIVASATEGSLLLWRAHGKVGNSWREAMIADAAASDSALSKREARERVAELAPLPADLDLRLIDLPRHRLAEITRLATGGAS